MFNTVTVQLWRNCDDICLVQAMMFASFCYLHETEKKTYLDLNFAKKKKEKMKSNCSPGEFVPAACVVWQLL